MSWHQKGADGRETLMEGLWLPPPCHSDGTGSHEAEPWSVVSVVRGGLGTPGQVCPDMAKMVSFLPSDDLICLQKTEVGKKKIRKV